MPETYEYFIIEGECYDLRPWIPNHPGGSMWFENARGRDLTAAVHTYHKNPDYVL